MLKNFGFIGNEIFHDIKNGFIKNKYLLIYTLVRKSSFIGIWTYWDIRSLIATRCQSIHSYGGRLNIFKLNFIYVFDDDSLGEVKNERLCS